MRRMEFHRAKFRGTALDNAMLEDDVFSYCDFQDSTMWAASATRATFFMSPLPGKNVQSMIMDWAKVIDATELNGGVLAKEVSA